MTVLFRSSGAGVSPALTASSQGTSSALGGSRRVTTLNWNLVPSGHWARISVEDWVISSLVTGPKGCEEDGDALIVSVPFRPGLEAPAGAGAVTLVSSAVMVKCVGGLV